ncbi:MAG: CHASE domain-containing protein [Phycisphaeraceae bacterium]
MGAPSLLIRWVGRLRLPVVLGVLLIGVVISWLLMVQTQTNRHTQQTMAFESEADDHVALLERGLRSAMGQVRIVGDYLAAEPDVDLVSYHRFVLPLQQRYEVLHTIRWCPRVAGDERAGFEQAAQTMGLRGFGITEPGPKDTIVPAGPRDLYVPVLLVEPAQRAEKLRGLDMLALPDHEDALAQARDSGQVAGTQPVAFAGAPQGQWGVLFCSAVYRGSPQTQAQRREQLLGYAIGAVRVEAMVSVALRDLTQPRLNFAIYDLAATDHRLLYHYVSGETDPAEALPPLNPNPDDPRYRRYTLDAGGRSWEVVCTPGPHLLEQAADDHWVVLLWGLLVTALVTAILMGVIHYGDLMATSAQQREAANEQLRRHITERAAAEKALERANANLLQANDEMERFVSAVSHDLKTPIAAGDMMVVVLQNHLKAGRHDKAVEAAKDISTVCRRMRRIIDDLIQHSRGGFAPRDPKPIEVHRLVEQIFHDYRTAAQNCRAQLEVQPDLPAIMADRAQIESVFGNLLGNALKYGCTGAQPTITVGAVESNGELRFFVQDNGPGVPREHCERIFDLFQRLHSDDEGTGIGLATVRRIAQVYGGRTWAENGPQGGAIFWFVVPATLRVTLQPA